MPGSHPSQLAGTKVAILCVYVSVSRSFFCVFLSVAFGTLFLAVLRCFLLPFCLCLFVRVCVFRCIFCLIFCCCVISTLTQPALVLLLYMPDFVRFCPIFPCHVFLIQLLSNRRICIRAPFFRQKKKKKREKIEDYCRVVLLACFCCWFGRSSIAVGLASHIIVNYDS